MGRVTISALGQTGVTGTLEAQYAELRAKCIERFGADNCNAWLPRNMIYAVTRRGEQGRLPWWGWLLIGGIVGRVLK